MMKKYMPPEVVQALKRSGRWQEARNEEVPVIGELGQLSLCFALALAVVMSVCGLMGTCPSGQIARKTASSAAMGMLVFVALAFGALVYAFVVSDFSVLLVADHSHTLKPLVL